MEKYNVILAPSFKKSLNNTLSIYDIFSSSYSSKIEKKIYDAIALLEFFPYATPSIKFKNKPGYYRKFNIQKRFLIIFKISGDYIYLLYFIDARRDSKNYFKI